MLIEVLRLINKGDARDKRWLANRINMDDVTLNNVIFILKRKGYIKSGSSGASEYSKACLSCPSSSRSISNSSSSKTFTLTDKGKTLLRNTSKT